MKNKTTQIVLLLVLPLIASCASQAAETRSPVPTQVPRPTTASAPSSPTAEPIRATITVPPVSTAAPPPATRALDTAPIVSIPAGEFLMGSADNDRDANDDEKPAHRVSLAPFSIDKFEVTNVQYRKCVEAGKCSPPARTRSATRETYYGNAAFDNYPVIYVSWFDAKGYCEWTGKRLPTEAEWERGARGNDSRLFPWGNIWDGSKLNSCDRNCPFDYKDKTIDDAQADTSPVGFYPAGASPLGLMDMSGNVSEWVADWYSGGYYATLPRTNPKGPATGQEKVLRGGAWTTTKEPSRTTNRERTSPPDGKQDDIGFRCVKDAAL
jgi:formylglycine-generating enzyme required for sulfatase activity